MSEDARQHTDGHRMHSNSLRAFSDSQEALSRRARECYGVLAQSLRPMTDREVQLKLGYPEKNAVSPRITELLGDLWLEECGNTHDTLTGKSVRLLRAIPAWQRVQKIKVLMAARNTPQMEMAFA